MITNKHASVSPAHQGKTATKKFAIDISNRAPKTGTVVPSQPIYNPI